MYNSTSRKAEYWFQDLNKITDIDSLEKFYPTKGMSRAEKVNSLVRLSIVVGIVLSIYNRNSNLGLRGLRHAIMDEHMQRSTLLLP